MSSCVLFRFAVLVGFCASASSGVCREQDLIEASSFQVSIVEGDKTVAIGHALLSTDANKQIYLISATHVLKIACENSNEFLLLSIKNPSSEFKFPCPTSIQESEIDLFVAPVTVPSLDPQTLSPIGAPSTFVVGGAIEESYTLCEGIDLSKPIPYLPVYNGKFFMFKGNARIGCSGSGLFAKNGALRGVMKGFQLASKNPLYIPISTDLIQNKDQLSSSSTLTAREIINSGRGDPIDGGNRLGPEYTLALPNQTVKSMGLLLYSGLKTSDFIIHTPEINKSNTIPQMSYCYVADNKTWISHLRHHDKESSYENMSEWPYLDEYFDVLAGTPTKVLQNSIAKDSQGRPEISFKTYSNKGEASATVVRNGDVYQISLKGPNLEVRLQAGRLQISDAALDEKTYEFQDHNLCYRAVSIKNSSTGAVITFNISLELVYDLVLQESNLQFVVTRTQFANEKQFLSGNVETMDIYRVINSWRKR